MASVTGKHAEAPPFVVCFGGPEPGTVVWDDEAKPDPAQEEANAKREAQAEEAAKAAAAPAKPEPAHE